VERDGNSLNEILMGKIERHNIDMYGADAKINSSAARATRFIETNAMAIP
jgi:hypothetical protein